MASPVAVMLVEGDFHDELGPQALPDEILLGLPGARPAAAARTGAVGLQEG